MRGCTCCHNNVRRTDLKTSKKASTFSIHFFTDAFASLSCHLRPAVVVALMQWIAWLVTRVVKQSVGVAVFWLMMRNFIKLCMLHCAIGTNISVLFSQPYLCGTAHSNNQKLHNACTD
jgi:hypothetical protein